MGPHPAVAAVRLAVRRALAGTPDDQPALVACSGGADSVALAAGLAFEGQHNGRPVGLVTVDHGLQPGSAQRAAEVLELGRSLGLAPLRSVRVEVGTAGGPEAAARTARYAALAPLREQALILLGHTADDQAESVLLGLGRGSGIRSIAGMRPAVEGYLRPLLTLRRAQTEAACAAQQLPVWQDPHNSDPRFRRVRLRNEVLPLLEDVLAGGVTEALARTAGQLQDELDALELLAARALASATPAGTTSGGTTSGGTMPVGSTSGLLVSAFDDQPDAIISRALKRWAEQGGAGPLSAGQVRELWRLVRDWHGQLAIDLPGGFRAIRTSGTLNLISPGDQ